MKSAWCLVSFIILAKPNEAISLKKLFSWTPVEDPQQVNESLLYLESQVGLQRFGCPISAESVAFNSANFYPTESDRDQCRAQDIMTLYRVLKSSRFETFRNSSCQFNATEPTELFKCLYGASKHLEVNGTEPFTELQKVSGRSWLGCHITKLPWEEGFYMDGENYGATHRSRSQPNNELAQEARYRDHVAFCQKSDTTFLGNLLIDLNNTKSYNASCNTLRSRESNKMVECVDDSLSRVNKFKSLISSIRPQCAVCVYFRNQHMYLLDVCRFRESN